MISSHGSDIIPNLNDIRTKFGYNVLYEIPTFLNWKNGERKCIPIFINHQSLSVNRQQEKHSIVNPSHAGKLVFKSLPKEVIAK